MQYDAIILELMSRIKKLEDEVAQLKEAVSSAPAAPEPAEGAAAETGAQGGYSKMTVEMIDLCYAYGKLARRFPEKNPWDYAQQAAGETGMNKNSAFIYIYAVKCLLDGVVFKRAVNATAIKRYLDSIYREFGAPGLAKAIEATRGHVEYRRALGHQVNSLAAICDDYQRKLESA